MNKDFRIIPLVKRYSDYYKEEVYVIPCTVLNKERHVRGKLYEIDIEILDFVSAQLTRVQAKTFQGSLQYFTDIPFDTECIVRKLGDGHYDLIVYGIFNTGLIEALFGVRDILNNDEEEIMKIYEHHYSKFREWLGITKNVGKPFNREGEDLPF